MLLVTPAVTLTDRFDARTVFVLGCAVTGISTLAFAVFADGFWSGFLLRAIGGAGQAAVYMPGLRALTDRLKGGGQSRAVTFYTASHRTEEHTSALQSLMPTSYARFRLEK